MKKVLGFAIFLLSSVSALAECNPDGTQGEMNECKENNFKSAKKELELAFKNILEKAKKENSGYGPQPKNIEASQESWLSYAEQHCDLLESYGGSMAGGIYYSCLTEKYSERTRELSSYVCHPMLEGC